MTEVELLDRVPDKELILSKGNRRLMNFIAVTVVLFSSAGLAFFTYSLVINGELLKDLSPKKLETIEGARSLIIFIEFVLILICGLIGGSMMFYKKRLSWFLVLNFLFTFLILFTFLTIDTLLLDFNSGGMIAAILVLSIPFTLTLLLFKTSIRNFLQIKRVDLIFIALAPVLFFATRYLLFGSFIR